MKFPQRGLYAITQTEGKSIAEVLAEVEAALRGGATFEAKRRMTEKLQGLSSPSPSPSGGKKKH